MIYPLRDSCSRIVEILSRAQPLHGYSGLGKKQYQAQDGLQGFWISEQIFCMYITPCKRWPPPLMQMERSTEGMLFLPSLPTIGKLIPSENEEFTPLSTKEISPG